MLKKRKLNNDRNAIEACKTGNATMLRELIGSVDIDELGLLGIAAFEGHFKCLKLLLAHWATVDGTTDEYPSAPLMYASQFGHLSCVELLLKHGAKVNHKNSSNYTALMWASSWNQFECIKLLLEWSADPNIKNEDGETA